MLDVMLARVRASHLAGTIVVATTTNPEDDEIEPIALRQRVHCYRGHPTDLLDRHYRAALAHRATHVVKIPSDCPLIDPAVIDAVLAAYLARRPRLDFASNLHPATHPDGNDVEIMCFDALEAAWREAGRAFEREHTTPFIWNRPERFRLANVAWGARRDCALSHRVVLDYPADYDVICAVHAALSGSDPLFSVDDVVRYLDAHPAVMERNASHRGVSWYRDHIDELPALAARRLRRFARAS
jgi:spore coat polysaccharide biosynthesis protein SpsF